MLEDVRRGDLGGTEDRICVDLWLGVWGSGVWGFGGLGVWGFGVLGVWRFGVKG